MAADDDVVGNLEALLDDPSLGKKHGRPPTAATGTTSGLTRRTSFTSATSATRAKAATGSVLSESSFDSQASG